MASKKKQERKKLPKREMHRVWLSNEKPEERDLNRMIALLKEERQYTATIRDGMQLVIGLREAEERLKHGHSPTWEQTRLLEALFPRVVQHVRDMHHSAELERVRAELADLKTRMEVGATAAPVAKAVVSSKPVFNLKVSKSDTKPADNLLNSLKGLNR